MSRHVQSGRAQSVVRGAPVTPAAEPLERRRLLSALSIGHGPVGADTVLFPAPAEEVNLILRDVTKDATPPADTLTIVYHRGVRTLNVDTTGSSPGLIRVEPDAYAAAGTDGVVINITGSSAAPLIVVGTAGVDVVVNGATSPTKVFLGAGDDRYEGRTAVALSAYGGGGDDVLAGTDAADFLDGGPGNDRLYGGYGRDTLVGGFGDDALAGGGGADRLDGGPGLLGGHRGFPGYDSLDGGDGTDFLVAYRNADGPITTVVRPSDVNDRVLWVAPPVFVARWRPPVRTEVVGAV